MGEKKKKKEKNEKKEKIKGVYPIGLDQPAYGQLKEFRGQGQGWP